MKEMQFNRAVFYGIFIGILVLSNNLNAQTVMNKYAPKGFDSLRTEIPHGKIDSISYPSKTVGNNRRALIYTPPGF